VRENGSEEGIFLVEISEVIVGVDVGGNISPEHPFFAFFAKNIFEIEAILLPVRFNGAKKGSLVDLELYVDIGPSTRTQTSNIGEKSSKLCCCGIWCLPLG
jgi:hypothetical protein